MAAARHQKKPVKKPSRSSSSKATPKPENLTPWQRHERDIWIVVLVVIGLLAALAEAGLLGPVGRAISEALKLLFGAGRFFLPPLLVALGIALVWGKVEVERSRFVWGLALGIVSVCGLGDLAGGRPGVHASVAALGHAGGWIGVLIGGGLHRALGVGGAVVVLLALLVIAIMIVTGIGLRALVSGSIAFIRALGRLFSKWWTARPRSTRTYDDDATDEAELDDDSLGTEVAPALAPIIPSVSAIEEPRARDEQPSGLDADEAFYDDEDPGYEPYGEPSDSDVESTSSAVVPLGEKLSMMASEWVLPPASLLQRTKEQRQDRTATELAGRELVDALSAHGVETTLVGYTVGPTVTRFELELGPGVKVARVTSLNKDIAYAMASPDVRILAPIPGRSAIGVEVPNRQRSLVALGDLLAAEESVAATHPLDVPIGRDISGKTVVVNLGEMPHVLISGATGAGKSSCINSLITSLVMRATPDQVRLLLIDPKRVEMGQYNDLPHLLAPVVVDPKKAAATLAWAVKEMERRYDLLAECGARDITSYQQMMQRGELTPEPTIREQVAEAVERATGLASDVEESPGPEQLPYIVIVVDELNDLMMVAARDVEESVVRIAQMARAVGIHLVLATQRPSVDVITGVIKANVPSRMAFAVSSLADSRVILDQAGAERLIGKGDMLLVTASSNIARRLQSPWVSEDEVRRVVENWRAQGGRRETVVALDIPASRSSSGTGSGDDADDEILRQARELVIRTQSGSTSMLQRKLRVGFARAGRIMDQLEEEGVVAPGDGSKARKVLITLDEYDQQTSL